jgi:hypothetical protein
MEALGWATCYLLLRLSSLCGDSRSEIPAIWRSGFLGKSGHGRPNQPKKNLKKLKKKY